MSAELAACRTAAAAVLADYQREVATAEVAVRAMWAARLADMLGYLLAELERLGSRTGSSQSASHVNGDGSAVLSAADLMTVLNALSLGTDVTCIALAYRLGDDRG